MAWSVWQGWRGPVLPVEVAPSARKAARGLRWGKRRGKEALPLTACRAEGRTLPAGIFCFADEPWHRESYGHTARRRDVEEKALFYSSLLPAAILFNSKNVRRRPVFRGGFSPSASSQLHRKDTSLGNKANLPGEERSFRTEGRRNFLLAPY